MPRTPYIIRAEWADELRSLAKDVFEQELSDEDKEYDDGLDKLRDVAEVGEYLAHKVLVYLGTEGKD